MQEIFSNINSASDTSTRHSSVNEISASFFLPNFNNKMCLSTENSTQNEAANSEGNVSAHEYTFQTKIPFQLKGKFSEKLISI